MGESAGLECKTAFSLDLKQFNGVEFPIRVLRPMRPLA